MKIKYIVLFVLLALVGCQRDKEMEMVWVKISNEVIEPCYNYVRISCTISSNATVDGATVLLSTTPEFSKSTRYTMGKQNDGKYSITIAKLTHGTTYYVRYEATNYWSSLELSAISEFQTAYTKKIAIVTTTPVTDISYTSATVGGNVTADGGLHVTERGVCYSINPNPTTNNTKIASGTGKGLFSCNLSDLQIGTKYYIRAYAINDEGVTYGEEISFTTMQLKEGEGIERGYRYMDLGLSVKWAKCNVGAETETDYGDYFAWGEIEPKKQYDLSTYKWFNNSENQLTKYNTASSYGGVDNKVVLEASDDAATANWGGSWRMPTNVELNELINFCTWTWTTQNGVNGYKVTSKSNGNSIFLPAAGLRYDSSLYDAGNGGCYWSSSLDFIPEYARSVWFDAGTIVWGSGSRWDAASVRPVYP